MLLLTYVFFHELSSMTPLIVMLMLMLVMMKMIIIMIMTMMTIR